MKVCDYGEHLSKEVRPLTVTPKGPVAWLCQAHYERERVEGDPTWDEAGGQKRGDSSRG